MTGQTGGRRLCADSPRTIPHIVDRPRAQRCDQHRTQRHKWSDANLYRKKVGLPPKEWVPEPLAPERRREALALFNDDNASTVLIIARQLNLATQEVTYLRPRVNQETRQLVLSIEEQLGTITHNLYDLARVMGAQAPFARPTNPQTPPQRH